MEVIITITCLTQIDLLTNFSPVSESSSDPAPKICSLISSSSLSFMANEFKSRSIVTSLNLMKQFWYF